MNDDKTVYFWEKSSFIAILSWEDLLLFALISKGGIGALLVTFLARRRPKAKGDFKWRLE